MGREFNTTEILKVVTAFVLSAALALVFAFVVETTHALFAGESLAEQKLIDHVAGVITHLIWL
jgi:hypothetical protein